jgi:hypothetical protein
MSSAEKVIETLAGRIVRLSEESIRLLRANDIVPKNGLVSGVVRNPKTGEFAGLLNFEKVDLATSLASSLPALAAGVALQMQLARIEKQLGAIEGKLDYVIKQGQLQIEARLLAALQILDEVAADCLSQGFVDDDSWDRLNQIDHDVRELAAWAAGNLRPVHQALSDTKLSLPKKVQVLRDALERDRAGWWLKARVAAEVALLRWEQLRLMRRAMTTPDELDRVAAKIEQDVLNRRMELMGLRQALGPWAESTHRTERILDRLRILKRRELERLLAQLPPMVEAYEAGITQPLPAIAPPVLPQGQDLS